MDRFQVNCRVHVLENQWPSSLTTCLPTLVKHTITCETVPHDSRVIHRPGYQVSRVRRPTHVIHVLDVAPEAKHTLTRTHWPAQASLSPHGPHDTPRFLIQVLVWRCQVSLRRFQRILLPQIHNVVYDKCSNRHVNPTPPKKRENKLLWNIPSPPDAKICPTRIQIKTHH